MKQLLGASAPFGSQPFVAPQKATGPLILSTGQSTGSITIPFSGGLAVQPSSGAFAIVTVTNATQSMGTFTQTINGAASRTPVSPTGQGGARFAIKVYSWIPNASDTGFTFTDTNGNDLLNAVAVFVPSIGQHMNLNGTAFKSNAIFSGDSSNHSGSVTPLPFAVNDTAMSWGWEISDVPFQNVSRGIPSLSGGPNTILSGRFLGLISVVAGYSLATSASTITRGSDAGTVPDSIILNDCVYGHI